MSERRQGDERVEKKITELAVAVVGMKGAMEGLSRALQTDVEQVQEQLDKQRRLAKYNRRTHFMVLSWVVVFVLLVSDVGRRYCGGGAGTQVDGWVGATCNVTFWTTEHGGGPGWRWAGLGLHLLALFIFWRRAQVPRDLWGEIATAQVADERMKRRARRRKWRVS